MERRDFLAVPASTGLAVGLALLPACGGGEIAAPGALERPREVLARAFSAQAAATVALHTPLVAGTAAGSIVVSGELAASAPLAPIGVRVTVNPGDDVVAAARLLAGGPDVLTLNPGDSIDLAVSTDVAAVYLVGVGAGPTPATYAGGACILGQSESDIADALENQARLTFIEPAIRLLRITVSAVYEPRALTVWVVGASSA